MTNATATDLRTLIETEVPEGRQNLECSYANLERVAAYCEANYLQAADKQAALEETRKYTVQSLASVAYQVNTLASNLLQMLELQADKISDMESQVNNIAQIVDIHKEKVARREIGVLTTNKSVLRQHKIITPVQQEKPQRYIRRQIDYSILDELGHGVKLQPPGHTNRQLNASRTVSTASGGSSGSGSEVVSHHGYPYAHLSNTGPGSVSKIEYRPMTVAAPTLPVSDYIQQRYFGLTQTDQGANQQLLPHSVGGYSSVNIGSRRSHLESYGNASPSGIPPPMEPISTLQYRRSGNNAMEVSDGLPPPPSPNAFEYPSQYSPPLPPPPMDESTEIGMAEDGSASFVDLPQYGMYLGRGNRNSVPDWVPHNFIEKVIAIYDYQAEKPDELSFSENSVIYVLKKNEDGWFEGVMDGMTGLFPGNYVEPCL